MPSPIPSLPVTANANPNDRKPNFKPKRLFRRRGRGRDDLSDEEVERDALTDSDASSYLTDSEDEDDHEERVLRKTSGEPNGTSSLKDFVRSSAPSPASPVTIPPHDATKSTIPAPVDWSERVAAEDNEGPEALPVIDFAEHGSLATVATHDPPTTSTTPASRQTPSSLTKLERVKLKRKAKKEKHRAAMAAKPADLLPSSSASPPAPRTSSPTVEIPAAPSSTANPAAPSSSDLPESAAMSQPLVSSRPPKPNPRQAYLERLSNDPSYVPRVGAFWGHDDRLMDKELRSMSPWWRGRGRGGFRGGARGDGGVGRGGGLPFSPVRDDSEGVRNAAHGHGDRDGRGSETNAGGRSDIVAPSPSGDGKAAENAPEAQSTDPTAVSVVGNDSEVKPSNGDTSRDSGSWHARGARGRGRGRGISRGAVFRGSSEGPSSPSLQSPTSLVNGLARTRGNGKKPPTGPRTTPVVGRRTSVNSQPLTPVSTANGWPRSGSGDITPNSVSSSASGVRVKLPGTSLPISIQVSSDDLAGKLSAPATASPISNAATAERSDAGSEGSGTASRRPPMVKLPSSSKTFPKSAMTRQKGRVNISGSVAAAASAAARSSAHVKSPLATEIPLPPLVTLGSAQDPSPSSDRSNLSQQVGEKDPFVVHIPPDETRASMVRQTIQNAVQPPISTIVDTPAPSTKVSSAPVLSVDTSILSSTTLEPTVTLPPPIPGTFVPVAPPSSYGGPGLNLPPGVAVDENGVLFEIATGRPVLLTHPQPQYQPFQPSRMMYGPFTGQVPGQTASSAPEDATPLVLPVLGPYGAVHGGRSAGSPDPSHRSPYVVNRSGTPGSEGFLSMDIGGGAPPVPIFVPARSSGPLSIRAPSAESSTSTTGNKTVSSSATAASLPTSPSTVFVPGSKSWSPPSLSSATQKSKAQAPSNLRLSVPTAESAQEENYNRKLSNASSFASPSHLQYFQPSYGLSNGYYPPPEYPLYAPVYGSESQAPMQMQYGGYYPETHYPGGANYYTHVDPYGGSMHQNPYGAVYYGSAPNPYLPPLNAVVAPGSTDALAEDDSRPYYPV